MPMTVAEIVEAARQLSVEERELLVKALQEDEFAAWQQQFDEPDPGYDEWFRARVQEALDDDSPTILHEEVVKEMDELLRDAIERKKLKASA